MRDVMNDGAFLHFNISLPLLQVVTLLGLMFCYELVLMLVGHARDISAGKKLGPLACGF
jgi:hypothetical protein